MADNLYRTGKDSTGDVWEVDVSHEICRVNLTPTPAYFFSVGRYGQDDRSLFAGFVASLVEAGEVVFGKEFTAALDAARGKAGDTGTEVGTETLDAPWYTVPAGAHVLDIAGVVRASIWPKGAGMFLVYLWNDRDNRLVEQHVNFMSVTDAAAWVEKRLGLPKPKPQSVGDWAPGPWWTGDHIWRGENSCASVEIPRCATPDDSKPWRATVTFPSRPSGVSVASGRFKSKADAMRWCEQHDAVADVIAAHQEAADKQQQDEWTPGPWWTPSERGVVVYVGDYEVASAHRQPDGHIFGMVWCEPESRWRRSTRLSSIHDAQRWCEEHPEMVDVIATWASSAPREAEAPRFNKVRAVFMQTVKDGPDHWTTAPVIVDLDQNAPLSDALDAILAAHGNVARVTCHLTFERSKGDG